MSTDITTGSLRIEGLGSRPVFFCATVLTLLGVLAIVLPQIATLATVLFIGWLLLAAGAGGLYVAIQGRDVFNWCCFPVYSSRVYRIKACRFVPH